MPVGFIKTPLEIMELILYILARVDGPIDMGNLADLSMCDQGVDYFQFSDALGKLETTGHVVQNEKGEYLITEKGRVNGKTTEEELPYSVRVRCDRNTAAHNRKVQRERQVRSSIKAREDGSGYTVQMILDDESGNVMTLELIAPDQVQADLISQHFQAQPGRLFNVILDELLREDQE